MAGFPVGVYASVLCLLADFYNRPRKYWLGLYMKYVIWQLTVDKGGGGAVTYPSLKFIYLYFHISESCWKLFSTISFISKLKCVIRIKSGHLLVLMLTINMPIPCLIVGVKISSHISIYIVKRVTYSRMNVNLHLNCVACTCNSFHFLGYQCYRCLIWC